MSIIIMRHAEASWEMLSDKERTLTNTGMMEARSTASQLIESGYVADRVCTSPYLRARQTGEIVAEVFSCSNVEVVQELSPTSHGDVILDMMPSYGVTLFVSHMPLVSRLVSLLCGDNLSADIAGGFCLAQATVVIFEEEVSIGLGRPCKIVTPEYL